MTGREGHLKVLSFDELLRSSRTTTSPVQYTQNNRAARSSLRSIASSAVSETQDLQPVAYDFGTNHPRCTPFNFVTDIQMVREQAPATNPLMPSQGRVESSAAGNEKTPIEIASSPIAPKPTHTHPLSPQPAFGQPTALNNNASPLAKPSAARTQQGQTVIRRSGDATHANLFAKKRPGEFGAYRPPGSGNPLANIGGHPRPAQSQQQSHGNSSEDTHNLTRGGYPTHAQSQIYANPLNVPHPTSDPFMIPRPANPPARFQPVPPQTFSSSSNTNPYMQPARPFIDLTNPSYQSAEGDGEGFSDKHVFSGDRFGTVDPLMYLDSRQADEDIKALLEGAMDEEAERPGTRRRKKDIDQKVDALTKKLQGVHVKTDDEEQEYEEEDEDDGTREGLKVKLLPHQIDGVNWMRDKELGTKRVKGVLPKGGILADDMGLGKTIQSIALILSNPKPSTEELAKSKRKLDPSTDRATLVVAPLALIKQWEAEIKDRIDEEHMLKVKVHHGPQRTKSFKDLRKYDVVITTYQTLSSEHNEGSTSEKSALFGVNWYRVILDEAHSIKNRNAKTTKAAYDINAEYRWCLTGTPMQNNLDELQSLIRFLRIKPYDRLEVWREQITKPMNNGRGGLSIRRLRAFLSAFMKRRTKDVLKLDGALKTGSNGQQKQSNTGFKIVKRTVEKVEAEFSGQELAFYQRLETRTDKSLERMMMGGNQMSYASALVLLMRLRQACNHPQLLGADLSREQDPTAGSKTPSRKTSKVDGMDDIANMLGGLSVESKLCDICQIELTKDAVQQGQLRCTECEEDLKLTQSTAFNTKTSRKKQKVKKQRKVNRRVVVDSDDEEHEEEITHESETEEEVEHDESTSDEAESGSDYDSSPQAPRTSPTSSTKIRQLLKILKHDSHTHKYIVFSFFTSMLDLIEPFLKRHNLKFVRYDGAMRNDAREASLEQLRTNSNVRILLCSLRAGSLGLNLTAASRVVILEPFWNPFVEEQAIDRVHRLNQTQDVVVHKLTIRDSVEERILELQEKKRELANATIEGQKGIGATKLSLQEMLKLFRHDGEKDTRLDMIGMKDGRSLLERDSQSTSTAAATTQRGPPVRETRDESVMLRNGAGKPKRAEDPIYGRRW
ncbi:hypothetical protein LTS08_006537 [Lithohypha guttulata]|nr:hypothetical protein LTS08_006537 [Lithohypha guttulata]